MTQLLGIDEGTSAVKAVLYDEDLQPLREARREKPLSHPRPGWVEQDPQVVMSAVVDAVGELLDEADGEIGACGLDHQGESVLAWDAASGEPLTPVVTWQDKRSQEVLDRLESDGGGDAVKRRSGLPLDPYFSAGKLTWLLEHDEAVARGAEQARCGSAPWTRGCATGSAPALPPTRRPRPAPSFPCRARPTGTASCSRPSPCRAKRCPRSATAPATWACFHTPTGRGSCRWPRASWTSRRRSPERDAWSPASSRPLMAPGCSCWRTWAMRRPSPGDGLLPTVAWRVGGRVEYALDGGVFTAGALLEWMSRDLGLAADPPGWRRSRPKSPTRAACACSRRWPAWARRGGSRMRAPCSPG